MAGMSSWGVVDDRQARAVPAGHAAVDAGHLLVGEAAVAGAFGVALQDDVQAREEDHRQQAGAHVPLPAAEAHDRAVREDGVVQDAGDAVGEEVAGGEAVGAAGQAVLGLGVVVPAGLRVGEARADPFADVVQADVGRGDAAVVRPVLGDAGLAPRRPGRSGGRRGWWPSGRVPWPRRAVPSACRPGRRVAAGRARWYRGPAGRTGAARAAAPGRRGAAAGAGPAGPGSPLPEAAAGERGAGPWEAPGCGPGWCAADTQPACGTCPGWWGGRQRRPHCVLHPLPLRLVQAIRVLAAGGAPRCLPN